MNPGFHKLGAWVAAHPRRVIGLWAVAIVIGALGAYKLPQVAVGGAGGIDGSPSKAAGDMLRTDFQNPFIDPLVVAVSAPRLQVDTAPYLTWVKHVATALEALSEVRKVSSFADTRESRMRSADGHVTLLLVGLASPNTEAQQRAVAVLRDALAPLRAHSSIWTRYRLRKSCVIAAVGPWNGT